MPYEDQIIWILCARLNRKSIVKYKNHTSYIQNNDQKTYT